jgi:osmotically-inducible protein OsmY
MKKLIILTGMLLAVITVASPQEKLNDREIADAIEDEYIWDHAINNNHINVKVTFGIAELTGTVSNLAAKERASKIAELVKGVRSVSNRIEVHPPSDISDDGLKDNVEFALKLDPATDFYEIDVSVNNKVVELTGTVDSFKERELCEKVAMSVTGVKELINNISVDFKTERPDSEIRNDIIKALQWNIMVRDGLIDVKVTNGNVELSGVVGSASEKRNAYFTSIVAGVRSIDHSGLEVRWWANDKNLRKNKYPARTDQEIENSIEDAILYDPRVFSFEIKPESDNGWVTLRGEVDNLKAKLVAEKIAEHTTGVIGVTNRIKVKDGETFPSDREIEAGIYSALQNNATTESTDISVDVKNGTATLSGTVDSYLEKKEAEWVASDIKGVTDVNNTLRVNYPYSYYWWGSYPYFDLYMTPPSSEYLTRRMDDKQIKKEVENQLWWSPFVDSDEVTVMVDDGNVTLTGRVDSWREYRIAAINAWEGGAYSVDNKLIVE